MHIFSTLLSIIGGLCLFLYGMKIMSDGIQRAAGDRLQSFLNFMTNNRFMGVFTGFAITAIIQSSSATTVMVVSLVNAGLLNLTQSIGVIMGANIGTTVTAWIVSLVGFSPNISALILPAIGIGFIWSAINWKYKSIGSIILGFGLLFMGLNFMTGAMPVGDTFNFIENLKNLGFLSYIIAVLVGAVMTAILNSSSAATAVTLTMAYSGIINYEMAASMVLGANIGTTLTTAIASLGSNTDARRAAMVHILFNFLGTFWALPFLRPLLELVDFITPGAMTGEPLDAMVTVRLAMLHTIFNSINTILFLPFVNQLAALVSFLVKDKKSREEMQGHYRLEYKVARFRNTPEFNILRAEIEIRRMAALASEMYGKFSDALVSMQEAPLTEEKAKALSSELKDKENFADEMREAITTFLLECSKDVLNRRSELRISRLLRIIADLEDMTDDCFSLSLILEKSVEKNHTFKSKEVTALIPYVSLISEFLVFLGNNMDGALSKEQTAWARKMENRIDKYRDKLRKLGRKRIEAGKDVRRELLFIDMVRRIEKLGDYCFNISEALAK